METSEDNHAETTTTTIHKSDRDESSKDLENNSQKNNYKNNEDDSSVFCVPTIPVTQHVTQQPPAPPPLKYTKPDWSAMPPDAKGENILDEEGFCDHYFLEVIKNGTVIDKIIMNKEFLTFGRLDCCDVLCEHPTLSRYHAILQYSNGDNIKFPEGFYLYDLNSTQGTFLNKKRINPNEYVLVNLDCIIKFAASTRMYILHGPKPKKYSDDLNINLTHEQMKKIKEKYSKISLKMKVRKELEEEEEIERMKDGDESGKGIDWGMNDPLENDDDDKEVGDQENPFASIEETDESFYASDPKKALKNYFDREGEELEYEVDELAIGKYSCRVRLPISNNYGEPIYAEVKHDGKKKDSMAACALEACRILNSEGVLRQSQQESRNKKKQKDWESADYYDSDEDTYLDRTGDIEKKRKNRMAKMGKAKDSQATNKNKVHTFESLLSDLKGLITEKHEIEKKLEACKDVFKAISEDDVDAYIESLKVGTIDTVTRAKYKRRLVELNAELVRVEKLLSVAKSSSFDTNKWKHELLDELNSKNTKTTQVEPVQRIETEKTENKIEKIEKPIEKIEKATSEPKPISATINENLHKTTSKRHQTSIEERADKQDDKTSDNDIEPSTSSKKIKKSKLKPEEESATDETDYDYEKTYKSNPKDYAIWVPPEDQTGDGKTKLNEKYGY